MQELICHINKLNVTKSIYFKHEQLNEYNVLLQKSQKEDLRISLHI